ncbi:sensor histidine kinase [Neorhizobium alkalisoli]|uniref:Blue-light-activated histidine kinase n=1 Tax=Neorhizobium alkalisoli TaxID=528178 RepID=A0A561QGJ3_9HYPH|nr:HWE histidine kinase domain-containing protein [Neorhizobium alkalisoli]TWF49502.1 PAS domain S-box-containing protein [Neorhizobium alkalisoli]
MPSMLDLDDPFRFLGNDGEVAGIIRNYDWASTPLGPVESWPPSLKTSTALLLQSPVPIVMLWGEAGVMIYNDAYSVFAGHRHPSLFGSNVREGWAEIADFNDNVMNVGLSGRTLAYRDQELTLHRKGYPEQVWMDLDYSPVPDEEGKPAGVIAIVVETTDRVLAERRNKEEFQRLQSLFEQAPTFMAMLSGKEHRFELVNPGYRELIGGRDVAGKTIIEALPELTGQGYYELLDEVFATGQTVRRFSERVYLQREVDAPPEERFVDYVYQPIRDETGIVTHIFVQGSDVTERVRAEQRQRLLINELNHRVKNTLASIQSIVSQTLRGVHSKEEASAAITARILAMSRAHNVLTEENWDSADLLTMVESSMDAFRIEGREAIRISGPNIRVGPHAAMSIALALHELGTNAARYGALSSPTGIVDLHWNLDENEQFELVWSEEGGPAVFESERKGFGSRLILQVLPRELRGTAELVRRSSGIVFKLSTSLEAISDRPVVEGV